MQWRLRNNQEYRDVKVLRDLSRRIVYAVHYIHSNGIVHRGPKPLSFLRLILSLIDTDASTDIQPGNFMLTFHNSQETISEVDLEEHTRLRWSQKVFPLRRVDGKPLNIHSPSYVVEPQPFDGGITNVS